MSSRGRSFASCSKGAFDLDADFLDAEECVSDDKDVDNGRTTEGLDHGEGEGEAIEYKRPAQMNGVGEGHRRLANSFAAAEVVDQELNVLVHRSEHDVSDQAALGAPSGGNRTCCRRQRERDVTSSKDAERNDGSNAQP